MGKIVQRRNKMLANSDNTAGCYLFLYGLSQLPSVGHDSCCCLLRYCKMRLGYEKCLLLSVVRFNKMDVSDEESELKTNTTRHCQ
jgi:hypothetical protein